jgi:ABC-type uncharacterized transport system ATPase subunit
VHFPGPALPASPAWLVHAGVARIPEDRHGVGVVGDLPVWENAVSERLRSPAFSRWSWVVRRRPRRLHARAHRKGLRRARRRADTPARSLSGGNMQKADPGRALLAPIRDDKKYPRARPA